MKKSFVFLLVTLVLLLSACGSNSSNASSGAASQSGGASSAPAADTAYFASFESEDKGYTIAYPQEYLFVSSSMPLEMREEMLSKFNETARASLDMATIEGYWLLPGDSEEYAFADNINLGITPAGGITQEMMTSDENFASDFGEGVAAQISSLFPDYVSLEDANVKELGSNIFVTHSAHYMMNDIPIYLKQYMTINGENQFVFTLSCTTEETLDAVPIEDILSTLVFA